MAYKNLISWISNNKDLKNNDFEIGVTSIKLNNAQKKKLNNLLEKQNKLNSGFVFCNIQAKLYYTEFDEDNGDNGDIVVPLGSKNYGNEKFDDDDLSDISFDPNFTVLDKNDKFANLVKKGLERLCGSPENIYHVRDFFKPFIEENEEKILKHLNSINNMVLEFEKFFMEIKLPCWIEWWVQDDKDNMVEPWNDPEYDSGGIHIWCNFDYDLLMQALNLLAKGEEVFFETVVDVVPA